MILLSNSIQDTNEEYFVCAHELGHALCTQTHQDITL
ncbi:ImmA/IrrE family metallo-endopeptidase [Enterococcus termitis]